MQYPKTITYSTLPSINCSTVGCTFGESTRTYTYLTCLDLEVGDKVLVSVRGEYKVITVAVLNPPAPNPEKINYQWIVAKLDKGDYEQVKNIKLVP